MRLKGDLHNRRSTGQLMHTGFGSTSLRKFHFAAATRRRRTKYSPLHAMANSH
jgi:hypothetical protein